jgi:GNAT superfamily N-acetyltransferase
VIELRPVADESDLDAWVEVTNAVVPNEPTTAERIGSTDEPDRLLLLAELDGRLAGCGIAKPSSLNGLAYLAARVLPDQRRRGVGSRLTSALADHARSLGLQRANVHVYADEPHSIAFAEHLGLVEVDYQLEQVRMVGEEAAPRPIEGIELVALGARRLELLRLAWPVALAGYQDMPLPGEITVTLDEWLREEATRPDGSFVAYEDGGLIGYAGLIEHTDGPATAEHGLTVVRRDRRGRGIAHLMKRAQLHWASTNGVTRIVTWTQRGNEAMQAVNRSLGYSDASKVITYQGPLKS